MKKNILLITVSVLFFAKVNAQVAYYDALILKECLSKKTGQVSQSQLTQLINALDHYKLSPNPNLTFAVGTTVKVTEIINYAKLTNPFFEDIKNNQFVVITDNPGEQVKNFNNVKPSEMAGPKNPGVTNLADGVSRFLIKRGKEELDVAFFNKMKIFLNQHEECRILFPTTTGFLSRIAAYRYSEMIQSLRLAFQSDLNNLIINLNRIMGSENYQKFLIQFPEVRLALQSLMIVSELSQADAPNPAQIIHQLAGNPELVKLNINLGNAFKVLELLSDAVRYKESEILWVPLNQMNKEIFNDKATLKLFLGLLYEKAESIEFKVKKANVVSFQNYLAQNKDNIANLSVLIENFALIANDLNKIIVEIDGKDSEERTKEEYYTLLTKTINLLEYGSLVAKTVLPEIKNDPYLLIAGESNELYKNIYTKNYNMAVYNAYVILNQTFEADPPLLKEQALRIGMDLNAQAYKDLEEKIKSYELPEAKVIAAFLKYGNFMASVIKSETPEDVEKAIESAALPAGSSSIKKNVIWNIALNAYVGYYTGGRLNSNISDGWHNNRGVTAPIGITLSKSLGKIDNFNLGSFSAFTSLLNLGAIVDYRLNDDKSAIKQEIRMENIFSPGGYLVYGLFGGLPLSVGYGYQYGPRIFKVSADELSLTDKPGWRKNFFFTIDIPIANFWSLSKKGRL